MAEAAGPGAQDPRLDAAQREQLLRSGGECTLIWGTREGWPVGVTMGYVWARERFWMVTGADRPRARAIRRDPRVSIVVSAPPRSVTAKGRCSLRDDPEARSWVYREIAEHQARLHPALVDADAFESYMAANERLILEVVPEKWITYDGSNVTSTR